MKDPTWTHIISALDRASAYASRKRYRWSGQSCYLVSALALDLIMSTRHGRKVWLDGLPTLPVPHPNDINLAYADHYLDMHKRLFGKFGPKRASALRAGAYLYDEYKRVVIGMGNLPGGKNAKPFDNFYKGVGKFLEYQSREDKSNPLSVPTKASEYWAVEGIKDGVTDFIANPDIDNNVDALK